MTKLEPKRSRLHATDGTERQGRSGPEMNASMTMRRITPRPAFRLLTLVLLIFALADLLPTRGSWRMAVSGFAALMLAGMLAAWIGLARVPGRAAMGSPPDRSTATPFKSARPSIIRGRMGPEQP